MSNDSYGNYTNLYPVFLNIKEPYSAQEDFLENFGNFDSVAEAIEHYKKEGFIEEELNETDFGNLDSADGVIVNSISENFNEVVVKNPNQIKHIDNLGTFNPKTDNIYDNDYETITELNKYDQSIDAWVVDQIIEAKKNDPNADVLQIAQKDKHEWVENRHK